MYGLQYFFKKKSFFQDKGKKEYVVSINPILFDRNEK